MSEDRRGWFRLEVGLLMVRRARRMLACYEGVTYVEERRGLYGSEFVGTGTELQLIQMHAEFAA